MQYQGAETQGYPHQHPPPPTHYNPTNCGYTPYYSWGYPTPYNAFPGSVFNTGGGTPTIGDVNAGNHKEKSGGSVDIGKIGGNQENRHDRQVSGDVTLGNTAGP